MDNGIKYCPQCIAAGNLYPNLVTHSVTNGREVAPDAIVWLQDDQAFGCQIHPARPTVAYLDGSIREWKMVTD